jgi:hypothetical protein
MPGLLKDGRFWFGFLAGYLLVVFVPQLSFKNVKSGKGPGGI